MTLMGRLCALCAAGALAEMAVENTDARAALRVIGGLLMLHLTLDGAQALAQRLMDAQGLMDVWQSLMG